MSEHSSKPQVATQVAYDIDISIAKRYGLATVVGACLVGAAVEIASGFAIQPLRRLFPPLVTGTVVLLIGLTLFPVGMDYAAGGVGAADYGSFPNLAIAGVVLLVTLLCNQLATGMLRHASVLVGVLVGYGMAAALGRVDLAPVGDAV